MWMRMRLDSYVALTLGFGLEVRGSTRLIRIGSIPEMKISHLSLELRVRNGDVGRARSWRAKEKCRIQEIQRLDLVLIPIR